MNNKNNMITFKYNLPNDIYTYGINCSEDKQKLYLDLLHENNAYNIIILNNNREVIYSE